MASSLPQRDTRYISAACSCAAAARAVLEVPPVPRMSTFFPASVSLMRRMSASIPGRSVLSPTSLPFRFTTVFTAPMARAVSLSSSR